MKNIDTLVEDIYRLFDLANKPNLSKTQANKILEQLGKEIKECLFDYLYNEPRGKNNLRLSAIGKPDRQLWYDMKNTNKEKQFTPATRIKFLYGHMLESLLIALTKLAGHTVTEEQKEVKVARCCRTSRL